MRYFTITSLLVCIVVGVLAAGSAEALVGLQPGVRAGYYDEVDGAFIGADVKFNIAMINANPSLEWAFPSGGNIVVLNLDGFIDFSIIPLVSLWAGGGIPIIHNRPDNGDSSWDSGVNIAGGAGFNVLLDPYVFVRYVITDNSRWVWGVGIRF